MGEVAARYRASAHVRSRCRLPRSLDHPEGFSPRAWDHPVASDGTIRRAAAGVLIASVSGCGRSAAQAGVDRKTARRYVEAAVEAGLVDDRGAAPLTDELVGQVAEKVRPMRHGRAWDRGYRDIPHLGSTCHGHGGGRQPAETPLP